MRHSFELLIALGALLMTGTGAANCFQDAGERYHIDPLLLYAIAQVEQNLLDEPCTSVMAGAWILAQFVQQLGYGWQAVGAYNAGARVERDANRSRYARRVWGYYASLLELRQRSAGTLAARNGGRP